MFLHLHIYFFIFYTLVTIKTAQVKGEVYLVDEAMLSQLDILEDHPTYYRSIQ